MQALCFKWYNEDVGLKLNYNVWMLVFLWSNEIINQQIDQHKRRDRWVALGGVGKIVDIKKTLDALFIKGLSSVWDRVGQDRKTEA